MTISHILFSIAGVLLLILFGYHFIWGNAAYAALRPERGSEDDESDKKFTAWLNGRAVFQMGSIDLLLPAALLILKMQSCKSCGNIKKRRRSIHF